MSHVEYCNAVFAGSPRYVTDKLQCVLNAAARLVTGTGNIKFDHGLSHGLLHEELHWLDVPLQTGSHSALLFAAQGSEVPGGLLYTNTSLRHSEPTSFTVSHSSKRPTYLNQIEAI